MKQYTFHPAPNCHPDRQYAPYNPAAFIPTYPSYNSNNSNNSNNKRHSVQNYTGIYNGFANSDRNGGNKPTRPTSYMPPPSSGQYYQAYRVNARRPSITTIPPAPTRPPPPPPRQSNPAPNPEAAKSKHLRRLSPLVIPASASPPPIFLKPEPPRMPPPPQQQQQQQQYRPYQVQPPPSNTLPQQHPRPPPPLLRPSPQRPPPRPASAEIESFLYQNPCMLPPMLPSPSTDHHLLPTTANKTPLTVSPLDRPRYSLPPLPSNAAPQLRRSKASRRASRTSAVVTPRRVSAGPWPLSAEPIVDEAISLVRKFSFEETRSSATEERKAMLVDVGAPPLRGGSVGGSSWEGGSEQEAVTPLEEDWVGETPAEYRMQQADALRELLGLVLEDEGEVEGVVGEFGYGEIEGGKGEGVVSVGVVGEEEEREMMARGLGRFSAEAYLAEIDEMKGVFV